jgi:hypothetical protein
MIAPRNTKMPRTTEGTPRCLSAKTAIHLVGSPNATAPANNSRALAKRGAESGLPCGRRQSANNYDFLFWPMFGNRSFTAALTVDDFSSVPLSAGIPQDVIRQMKPDLAKASSSRR